ncbi:MAG TPA: plastocyanin/azurin family copper-binding protein [Thermoleophilaceae bacterium]
MRRWAPFAALYVLTAVLLVPGAPLAAQEAAPAGAPSETAGSPGATQPPARTAPATQGEEPADAGSSSPAGADAGAGSQTTVPEATAPQPNAQETTAPQTAAPQAPAPESAPAPSTAASPELAAGAAPPTGKRGRPVARAAAPGSVTIKDFSFGPSTITVDVGDSVTWTNQDEVTHTATSPGTFDTGDIKPGTSRTATFDKAGSFSYICKPHPFMKGTVVVQAASSGGGENAGTGTTGGSATTTDSGATGSSSAATTATPSASSGTSLPRTGLDALLLAGLGVLFFGLGALVQRLSSPGQPRSARAGW